MKLKLFLIFIGILINLHAAQREHIPFSFPTLPAWVAPTPLAHEEKEEEETNEQKQKREKKEKHKRQAKELLSKIFPLTLEPTHIFEGNRGMLSPNSQWLITYYPGPQQIFRLFDRATAEQITLYDSSDNSLPKLEFVGSPVFNPNSQLMAVQGLLSVDSHVKIYDLNTRRLVLDLPGNDLIFSPDGSLIAITNRYTSNTSIYELSEKIADINREPLQIIPGIMPQFSKDSSKIKVDKLIPPALYVMEIYDISLQQKLLSSNIGDYLIVSDDFKYFYDMQKKDIYEIATNQHVLKLIDEKNTFYPGRFSPNSQYFALRYDAFKPEAEVRLYDIQAKKLLFTLKGEFKAFSPDSKLLITATADDKIKLYDIASTSSDLDYKESLDVNRSHLPSTIIEFSPNSLLLNITQFGTTYIYTIRSEQAPDEIMFSPTPILKISVSTRFNHDGTMLIGSPAKIRMQDPDLIFLYDITFLQNPEIQRLMQGRMSLQLLTALELLQDLQRTYGEKGIKLGTLALPVREAIRNVFTNLPHIVRNNLIKRYHLLDIEPTELEQEFAKKTKI